MQSVTILADDGLTSEALSGRVFVMGPERGLRFIETQPGGCRGRRCRRPPALPQACSTLLAGVQ